MLKTISWVQVFLSSVVFICTQRSIAALFSITFEWSSIMYRNMQAPNMKSPVSRKHNNNSLTLRTFVWSKRYPTLTITGKIKSISYLLLHYGFKHIFPFFTFLVQYHFIKPRLYRRMNILPKSFLMRNKTHPCAIEPCITKKLKTLKHLQYMRIR